jgi:predicted lipoprotein with Yx(FWY)xxD motif
MRRRFAAVLSAASISLAIPWTFPQAQAEGAKVEVSEKEPFGKYLTDAEGMSLYLFEADGKLNSTCSDACAQAWPPLLTDGEPTGGEGVDKGMLATFNRTDGSTRSPTMEGLFIISRGTKAPATPKVRMSRALARSGT